MKFLGVQRCVPDVQRYTTEFPFSVLNGDYSANLNGDYSKDYSAIQMAYKKLLVL